MATQSNAWILPFQGALPRIAADAFIAGNAVIIGNVEIGSQSGIWFGCVLRGDVNDIRIGEGTNIQDGTIIHVSHGNQGTYLGNDVTVGHMVLLHACTIEDRAFIGMKACLLDNVYVEQGGMVAAGSLVTPGKRVRSGELWMGNPARCKRMLTEEEKIGFGKTAPHYVELAGQYLQPHS